ncbi:hypothetical protein HDR66_01805 [bacterium]|nr:hypothetical protein [bacterium]
MSVRVVADFLFPVYNMSGNVRFLNTYVNDANIRWVNLWAISAMHGNEAESIARSLLDERQECIDSMAGATIRNQVILQKRARCMNQLISELYEPLYHKKADVNLSERIIADVYRAGYQTDLSRAVYLEGISHTR